MASFQDLFDIEQRPGAGLGLWTAQLTRQLGRVKDANYRFRLHSSPVESERREDKSAEEELHGEVYFLVLAIRRVLRFADALAAQVESPELDAARQRFKAEAPGALRARNLFEHIDEYLLDGPRKHMKEFEGRIFPILICRWDADNVVAAYGQERFDVTIASEAAIELGQAALAVWDAELERAKADDEDDEPFPEVDDGVPRAVQIKISPSTIIEGGEAGPEVSSGRLLSVQVREITQAEAGRLKRPER